MAALGGVRAVYPIRVELAGADFRQVAVPHEVGALAQRETLDLAPPASVEKAKLHALRVFGVKGEIDARAVPRGAKRRGAAAPDGARRNEGPDGCIHTPKLKRDGSFPDG